MTTAGEAEAGISSIIIATQVPVENWIEHIGDPTLADAILDRLVHNAHKINKRRIHEKNPFFIDEINQVWKENNNSVASLR